MSRSDRLTFDEELRGEFLMSEVEEKLRATGGPKTLGGMIAAVACGAVVSQLCQRVIAARGRAAACRALLADADAGKPFMLEFSQRVLERVVRHFPDLVGPTDESYPEFDAFVAAHAR